MKRAPLQQDIVQLIRMGFRRPIDMLYVLSHEYDISAETIRVTLGKMVKRGIIKRTNRGVYEAE